MNQLAYILLGLVAGVFGGMFGLGGGLIIIPALVYLFDFTQLQAQGTNLAIMLPPIGLLAALRYYQSGNIKLNIAGLVCLGFLVGGFFGASLVQNLPNPLLKKLFGILLFFMSIKMIFTK